MAIIRAYTTIEQSRKLAEILPLESADKYWMNGKLDNVKQQLTPKIIGNEHDEPLWDFDIPCWSLAALLGVLPYPSLHKTFSGWRCDTYNENCTQCQLGNTADTPVDACYEMILKLNELKML